MITAALFTSCACLTASQIPTLDELHIKAEIANDHIHDLSVTYRLLLESSVDTGHAWIPRSDISATYTEDSRFQQRVSTFYRGAQNEWVERCTTNFAFDGKETVQVLDCELLANIHPGPQWFCEPHGTGFFDVNMLNKPLGSAPGQRDTSLLGTLSSPNASVRPALESVNGVDCAVVDVTDPLFGSMLYTVWLDEARSCVPVKQEFKKSDGSVGIEYTSTKIVPFDGKVWLVLEAEKRVNWSEGKQDVWSIKVLNTAQNSSALQLNSYPAESTFKPTIPVGYTVIDPQGNEYIKK